MYKLIMLPNPILVSDEEIEYKDFFYSYKYKTIDTLYSNGVIDKNNCKKIIAGIDIKLDLSAIAEKIAWVDVEKLGYDRAVERRWNPNSLDTKRVAVEIIKAVEYGFKAAQSLNEKKYTLDDIENAFNSGRGYGNPDDIKDFNSFIQSISKPKEYNVDYIQEGNTIKVTKIIN